MVGFSFFTYLLPVVFDPFRVGIEKSGEKGGG